MSVAAHARAAAMLALLSVPARQLVLAELVKRGTATLQELAAALDMPLPKVAEICAKLDNLGLAIRSAKRYTAQLSSLQDAAKQLDALQPISALLPGYPRLMGAFSHGRLVSFPALLSPAYQDLAQMLARFLNLTEPVAEAEVNQRLADVSDDVALLRRMLVDTGWLARDRDGSTYRAAKPS